MSCKEIAAWKTPLFVAVLVLATIVEGGLVVLFAAQAHRSFGQTERALSVAKKWEAIAGKFETIANTNLHAAQECLSLKGP